MYSLSSVLRRESVLKDSIKIVLAGQHRDFRDWNTQDSVRSAKQLVKIAVSATSKPPGIRRQHADEPRHNHSQIELSGDGFDPCERSSRGRNGGHISITQSGKSHEAVVRTQPGSAAR